MITLHSIVLRYHSSFNRWYGYTESGVLVYFDFSFCGEADKLVSGHTYEVMGKIHPPARHQDGGPAFTLVVVAYTEVTSHE